MLKIKLVGILLLAAAATTFAQASVPATKPSDSQPAPRHVIAPTRSNEFLTQDQLVQAFREKQFLLVIRETGRILANPKLTPAYDRFNIHLLRCESLLQSKNFPAAIDAFTAASNEAPNEDRRALMLATIALIRHRSGTQYLPKTTDEYGNPRPEKPAPKKPPFIDILDLGQREAAFRALFFDQLTATRSGLRNVRSLAGLKDSMAAVETVAALETAAAGSQSETRKLQTDTAIVAEAILAALVVSQLDAVKNEQQQAQQTETVPADISLGGAGNPNRPATRTRGFDAAALKRIEASTDFLDKIPALIDDLTGHLHADPKLFDPTREKAAAIKKDIRTMLDSAAEKGLIH